jgi:preprotein translocase SecE subunit
VCSSDLIVRRIGVFLGEVGLEFRKTSWPERRELMESTTVVISFIALLSAVVLVCDKVIRFVLALIRA